MQTIKLFTAFVSSVIDRFRVAGGWCSEIERVKREGGRLYHDTRLAHPNLNPSFFNLGVSRSMYAHARFSLFVVLA
jgi:hypothetical protein